MSPEVNEYLPNQIYPPCNQSPLSGQPFVPVPKYDRSCDIAGGSCANIGHETTHLRNQTYDPTNSGI